MPVLYISYICILLNFMCDKELYRVGRWLSMAKVLYNVMETGELDFASILLTKMSSGHWDLLGMQLLGNRKGKPRASWLYRIGELLIFEFKQETLTSYIRRTAMNENTWCQHLTFTCMHMCTSTHTCAHSCGNRHACTSYRYIWRNKNCISV